MRAAWKMSGRTQTLQRVHMKLSKNIFADGGFQEGTEVFFFFLTDLTFKPLQEEKLDFFFFLEVFSLFTDLSLMQHLADVNQALLCSLIRPIV